MGKGPIRIGHILPMALAAHLLDCAPHLPGVGASQIMTGSAGPIAERLMNHGQTRHWRRSQPHIGRRWRRCGRNERRRRRGRRGRRRWATSRAQDSKADDGQQSQPFGQTTRGEHGGKGATVQILRIIISLSATPNLSLSHTYDLGHSLERDKKITSPYHAAPSFHQLIHPVDGQGQTRSKQTAQKHPGCGHQGQLPDASRHGQPGP